MDGNQSILGGVYQCANGITISHSLGAMGVNAQGSITRLV